ncbi:hypothetical protein BpHYR1_021692 [Brachionus plicatilis]|uniref:Uncharacterized protein n=1 Tax=Brachionus plicatilis TaxID=10195 RepID=A0A3M7QHQ5_BRAPC|nr:hypothetical protein BpHYR1_021692 [Brachionus plicatilis]
MKKDAKKLGETVANDFINNLVDYLIQIETLSITNASKEILNQNFNTPNELVEIALNSSFGTSNYQNVYKYVIDVNRYCKEVCFENIKKTGNTKFSSTKISSCREFFEILEKEAKEKNKSLDSIIGTEIKDFQLFISGFKQSIGNFDQQLYIKLEEFKNELDKRCKSEIIDYIDNYIGCNSKCPCCGSKNKDTKQILTNFCWEEGTFLNSKFYIGDEEYKKYKNCTEFLLNEHPEWLFDIKENYDEYGKNPSNSGNIKFRIQIMRAWMNTLDKKYDNEWLFLEDAENMLPEDHVPKWNENI